MDKIIFKATPYAEENILYGLPETTRKCSMLLQQSDKSPELAEKLLEIEKIFKLQTDFMEKILKDNKVELFSYVMLDHIRDTFKRLVETK
jgi:hypothetical protein